MKAGLWNEELREEIISSNGKFNTLPTHGRSFETDTTLRIDTGHHVYTY